MIYNLLRSDSSFKSYRGGGGGGARHHLPLLFCKSVYNFVSQETLLETFDTLIKPVMLFSTEVWADELKDENNAQSVLIINKVL